MKRLIYLPIFLLLASCSQPKERLSKMHCLDTALAFERLEVTNTELQLFSEGYALDTAGHFLVAPLIVKADTVFLSAYILRQPPNLKALLENKSFDVLSYRPNPEMNAEYCLARSGDEFRYSILWYSSSDVEALLLDVVSQDSAHLSELYQQQALSNLVEPC